VPRNLLFGTRFLGISISDEQATGMATYEQSTDVAVRADRLFAYLSRVGNLPKYFPAMTFAEMKDGESVHTTAVLDLPDGKREVEGTAWFRVHPDQQRLEWGSKGPNHYYGDLDVTGDGDTSTVSVRLHTVHADGPDIDQDLRETLDNLRDVVEGNS
jgi:hypothetical protein